MQKVLYRSTNYLFFSAGAGNIKGGHQNDALAAGVMFGAVGGAAAAMQRYNYLLDMKTGDIFPMTKKMMVDFLVNNPDLQKQYNAEKTPENKDVLVKYLAEVDR
ncbi:MAG: hypothetical protein EOP51_07305 [Sphingobacteriales bacterium]|nr:MAG: hypothetical protein EOP51_07305 [Sphingobacteriales bacterium]